MISFTVTFNVAGERVAELTKVRKAEGSRYSRKDGVS